MKILFLFMIILCTRGAAETDYKYYMYNNSVKIDFLHLWEGSILGDKFGYNYGHPTIYEYSWNSTKSVSDIEIFKNNNYDLLITVLDGRIYAEDAELRVSEDVWIPARTEFKMFLVTKKGKIRIVRLGESPREQSGQVPIVNIKRNSDFINDEHAMCNVLGKCAVDIISKNKTKYDPYLLSVFFLEDSEISLHEHPCGAIYYIIEGTMCYTQNSEETVCLEKGESYWTSPKNKYKEFAKKNTEIKVLGFQCPPVFYNKYSF